VQVNFFAVVRVTKAFMPLIKQYQLNQGGAKATTHARIVILSSLAGLGPGMPIMGAYSASKHAVEAFASSLRHEVAGWGIKVRIRGEPVATCLLHESWTACLRWKYLPLLAWKVLHSLCGEHFLYPPRE
jgi:short-subunit dehydrogenase